MNLSTSPVAHLKSMLSLHEKRARLQNELDAIDQQISQHQSQLGVSVSPSASSATAPTKRGPRAKRGGAGRGALKAKIFAALEKAGAQGVKVIPLAETLGTKSANVYAWFHAAAKRYKGIINKIGGAHYRLDGKLPGAAPASGAAPKAAAPKAAKAPKAGRKKRAPRGHLKDSIVAALTAAGAGGITVKEIAAKVGANYKNVAVWFATTGRNNSAIKKIAPARYRIGK